MSLFSPRESGNSNSQRYVWFDQSVYNASIVRDSLTGLPLLNETGSWTVSVVSKSVEWRGINLTISVKNISQNKKPAPFIKLDSGMYHPSWTGAGSDSNFRHIVNYFNHDSFGMRSEKCVYSGNISVDKFGNYNSVYGVNWFAPCLCVENYVLNIPSWGKQMTSVSTNYPFPCRIYGEFDSSKKGYFRIDGNVFIDGVGVVDEMESGEVRTWNVWIRFENYGNGDSESNEFHRKIAALRSYEPYFVWFWDNNQVNHGSKISGRIYGINLAGPKSPKAYFSPKDNPRRYFLFSSKDKISLEGRLPLPGQEYVRPDLVSGWKKLLDSIVDVSLLKQHGYQSIMLFNLSGWGDVDQGQDPSFYSNMPLNLRNSLSELKKWETDNDIRVIFSGDKILSKINVNEFNSLSVDFDENNPLHVNSLNDNVNGGLQSSSGLSLLSMPYLITKNFNKYFKTWRNNFPSSIMTSESRNINEIYTYLFPGYLDRKEFLNESFSKGGRDWFLDLLLGGVDPWVYMPIEQWYADFGLSLETELKYDTYVQKCEKDHQSVVVTIGRVVKNKCLMPNKLNWKQQFKTYSSVSVLDGSSSICESGDPVLGNRKICTNKEIHNSYSSNTPASLNYDIIGYYQEDGFNDWSTGVNHSWIPGLGRDSDPLSLFGNSLLWLWSDEVLSKVKQSIYNNINGINRPGGKYISDNYNGNLWLDFNCKLVSENGSLIEIGVGHSLDMYTDYQRSSLIKASDGSGLQSRTLRDWWIWVIDQIYPNWQNNKSVAEQDSFLQQKWVERWTLWLSEIISYIKSLRTGISKVFLRGAVPQYGMWNSDEISNINIMNKKDLEIEIWNDWLKLLDCISPTLYISRKNVDYDYPALYNSIDRKNSDPVQTRLFQILNIRNSHEIAISVNKPVVPFIYNQPTQDNTSFINSNILPFVYRSVYDGGSHGVIWWNTVYSRLDALNKITNIKDNWYDVLKYIELKNFSFLIDVEAPLPISDLSSSLSGGVIAKFGNIKIKSLGGKTKRDSIEGFGVQRYSFVPSGGVGDSFPKDYSNYNIVGILNSVDGTLELPKSVTKQDKLEIDIINPTLKNVGYPHWVIEDSFEWVNSGMPSHLSQVHHSNVISNNFSLERLMTGLQEEVAPLYQSKSIIPNSDNWYDKLNSTIDYDLVFDNQNRNLSLPYANCVLFNVEENSVLVGGFGGVLSIDRSSKNITKISIVSDRKLLIKDIKKYQNIIYILDESSVYFYNSTTKVTSVDDVEGLPFRLYSIGTLFGNTICVGGSDGIYARKNNSNSWEKVLLTDSPVSSISSPDALLATTENGQCYYSTDGFSWALVGVISDIIVNKIQKHRSQILIASNKGLYQDGGTFYSKALSIQLLNITGNIAQSSTVSVNDVDSDFAKAVIGLSDGRYFTYKSNFEIQEDSKLSTIHKVLILPDDIWIFGYDEFRIVSEQKIRKLSTGTII